MDRGRRAELRRPPQSSVTQRREGGRRDGTVTGWTDAREPLGSEQHTSARSTTLEGVRTCAVCSLTQPHVTPPSRR
ncbi:hypothetical protein ACFPRL_12845 [Pseudoclavibacter helvolus]